MHTDIRATLRRYSELVVTSHAYMRCVTRIDPLWLPELVPSMYREKAPVPAPPPGAKAPAAAPRRPATAGGIGIIPGAPTTARFK